MFKSTLRLCFLFILALSFQNLKAQSCCNTNATAQFADLASTEDFRSAHELPQPYTGKVLDGKMITFATETGESASAYFVGAKSVSNKYIFVIHEWWGLNDHVRAEGHKLAESMPGVNILCLDLYDGKVATTREKASEYMQGVSAERAEAIIIGAKNHVGKKAKIGSVGWCFGGGWSLQTAILLGSQHKACVIYYGMPEDDPKRLEKIEAPVLGLFAEQDKWITPKVVDNFVEKMEAKKKTILTYQYKADHAFANPSRPAHNEPAARDAWEKTVSFFQTNL